MEIIATLASWGICAVLRYGIGGEWENMPVFKLSLVGVISGTLIGIITVLIAANTKFFKVENALGIHHALNSNKPYSQDMTVYAQDYAPVLSKELATEIEKIDGIKYVYGRMHICDEMTSTKDVNSIDLISYEELQFGWAKDDYLSGDIEKVKNNK